jgi:hypothetical protein
VDRRRQYQVIPQVEQQRAVNVSHPTAGCATSWRSLLVPPGSSQLDQMSVTSVLKWLSRILMTASAWSVR